MKLPLADGHDFTVSTYGSQVVIDICRTGSVGRSIVRLARQEAISLAEHLFEAAADLATTDTCSTCGQEIDVLFTAAEINEPGDDLIITCLSCIAKRKDR